MPKDQQCQAGLFRKDRDKQKLSMCADSNFAAVAQAPDAAAASDRGAVDAAAFPHLPLCSLSSIYLGNICSPSVTHSAHSDVSC